MIGCRPTEKCGGGGGRVRAERLGVGECVKDDMDEHGLHSEKQCSGICGEASYRGKHIALAERGRNRRFKNK